MKKFLAAMLIGAFTLTGIGCSGEKDKDKKDVKDTVKDTVKDKATDTVKEKVTDTVKDKK